MEAYETPMKVSKEIIQDILGDKGIAFVEARLEENKKMVEDWSGMFETTLGHFEQYKRVGEFDFSKLEGSEKQIKWAEDIIRKNRLRHLCPKVRLVKRGRITEEELDQEIEKMNNPSAKWWIENR